jgi:shikimate kinase
MLSEAIGVPFSDTDSIIEKEVGKEINKIFDDSGERYFRQVEEKVVERTLEDNAHIISTGGGSIVSSNTRNLIKVKSFSIWIQCDVNIIAKRLLNHGDRPLLKNKNILDTLTKKHEDRIKFYSQADIHIKNENPNLSLTVDAIIRDLLFNKVIENNDQK